MKVRTEGALPVMKSNPQADPIALLKKAVADSLTALRGSGDESVSKVDQDAVTHGELGALLDTTREVMVQLTEKLKQENSPDNAQALQALESMTAEKVLAQVLSENPSLAQALTYKAAGSLAEKLNTADSFAEVERAGVLHGTTLQVPLDLDQNGELNEKDVVLDFDAVDPALHRDPTTNKFRINHWYDSQPGKPVEVKGSVSEGVVQKTQTRMREAAQAKLEAEQAALNRTAAFREAFAAGKTVWAAKLLDGDSGKFKEYLRSIREPADLTEKEMLDAVLPQVFADEEIATQLDFLKARSLVSGSSLPLKPMQYFGDEQNRYGVCEMHGRAYFRVSKGQLPDGLSQGMSAVGLPDEVRAKLAEPE